MNKSEQINFRIGNVPYLNAKPLTYGIEDRVSLHHPAQLADLLHTGKLDAGVVPIAECLAHDQYVVLEGASISCRGPVFSVIVAHRGPIEKVRKIFVDQASRTSVVLMQVILREKLGVTPELIPLPNYDPQDAPETLLLIGNQAMHFRFARSDYQILDLGQAWWEMTGLPFVFAAWAMQPAAAQSDLPALLLRARRDGEAHIEDIVKRETEFTESFRREYLTRNVRFDLGTEEKKGIAAFRGFLQKSREIRQVYDLRYITG